MGRRHGSARRWLAAALALALVLVACEGDEPPVDEVDEQHEDAAPPTEVDAEDHCAGSTDRELIWVHEQEPPHLHVDAPDNGLSITSWIQQPLLEGLYGVTSDTGFTPELLAEEIEVEDGGDGAVTLRHRLREDLRWSDGEPLTAADVRHTYELIMDEAFEIGSRQGYELIDPDSWELTSDTEFAYTSAPFSGYRSLFARVLPAHVLTDAAVANEALRSWSLEDGGTIPASGPLEFDGWDRGVDLTLRRNERYHGAHPDHPEVDNGDVACVGGVRIDFVDGTDEQIAALRAGEADVIFAPPRHAFVEQLAQDASATVVPLAGPTFEHWSFNLLNPHLSDVNVREALALAMDKTAVIEAVYTPLFGEALPARGLGNTYWMANQTAYVDHAGDAGYGRGDIDAARTVLERAGYVLAGDGVYEHPERGRLTLRVGTTGGDELRELQLEILQEQLVTLGVDVRVDSAPGASYFTERVFAPEALTCSMSQGDAGDCTLFDIAQFAWTGGPWPGRQSEVYRSGSASNPYGYANERFDAKADECDATLEDEALAACFNELDRLVTTRVDDDGVIVLPITQKPSVYAYAATRVERAAVAVDAFDAGPLVNVVDVRTAD